MRYIAIITATIVLTGCDIPKYETDQELRRETFKECMSALPAGPETTMYNDWAEVVSECRDYAYYTSRYCYKNCRGVK